MFLKNRTLLIRERADKHSSSRLWILWGILSDLLVVKDIKYLLILHIEGFASDKEKWTLKKPGTKPLPLSEEISDKEKDFVEGNDNTP